jgi:hypothetical protein
MIGHRKRRGRLAATRARVHLRSCFDPAAEAGGVEQRMAAAVGGDFRLQRREPIGVASEHERQRLVFVERTGSELGDADRMERARRNPPG